MDLWPLTRICAASKMPGVHLFCGCPLGNQSVDLEIVVIGEKVQIHPFFSTGPASEIELAKVNALYFTVQDEQIFNKSEDP